MDAGQAHDIYAVVNAALNTLQVCFLAYLAAKYRGNDRHG